ncbi:hypothetical protein CEP54_014435 [Fusarium duplospermum]|uniref:Uncharacterized protein n=1 Tax=Fusarium duplospermum TaxID=1325734 RepID=A0A428NW48_9HYPO|nr:hypothetical protein CEP54_014435 [Fusarium duplospermum]
MGRPHGSSAAGSSLSESLHSGSSSRPTTPRQPPISSRSKTSNVASPPPSSSSLSSPSRHLSHSPPLPPPPSPSSQWHRTGEHTVLRFRVNPHPDLAPGHRGLSVALCFHNGYWRSLAGGDDAITIQFNDHQHVVSHSAFQDDSHPLPSAPNYIIQSSDVNLWVEEDDSVDTEPVSPRHPEFRLRQPMPSVIHLQHPAAFIKQNDKDEIDERQPRRPINNKIIPWTGFAVLCYLVLAILISFFHSREQTPAVVYEATRFYSEATVVDVLPVYDRFHQLCLRQAFLPRNSTFYNLPFDTLDNHLLARIRVTCLPVTGIGTIWSREQGLTMDPVARGLYEESLKQSHPIFDGVDLYQLCSNVSETVGSAHQAFRRLLWDLETRATTTSRVALEGLVRKLIIRESMDGRSPTSTEPLGKPYTTGPATPPTPDPSPLLTLAFWKNTIDLKVGPNFHTLMDEKLKEMNEFRQVLRDALQHIDQVLDISRQVTEDATNTDNGTGTRELPFWKSWWIRSAHQQSRRTKLLRETKDSIAFFMSMRHNLTVVDSALEEVFIEQEDILREEEQIAAWIQLLLDAASLASQADSLGTVRLQNDAGDSFIAGRWHANFWAPYRPKLEKKEFGQWCLYPECPRAQGKGVLVRLHLPSPTEAIEAIFPIWVKEDVDLWKMAQSRDKEAKKDHS